MQRVPTLSSCWLRKLVHRLVVSPAYDGSQTDNPRHPKYFEVACFGMGVARLNLYWSGRKLCPIPLVPTHRHSNNFAGNFPNLDTLLWQIPGDGLTAYLDHRDGQDDGFTCGCTIRWHSHQRLVAWQSGVVMVNYSAAMICAGWIWPTSWPSSCLRTAYGMVLWWDLSFKMSTSGWCFCFSWYFVPTGQLAVFCWITSLSSADSTIRTGGNLLWLSSQSKALETWECFLHWLDLKQRVVHRHMSQV